MGKYISEILKQWKEESGAKGVIQFYYNYSTNILTIYASRCGYLIGKGGCYVDKYTGMLKGLLPELIRVKFEETDDCYIV